MKITNYGLFTYQDKDGTRFFTDKNGRDWYALIYGTPEAEGVEAVAPVEHAAWALALSVANDHMPAGLIISATTDPKTLSPRSVTVLGLDGLDADPSTLVGQVYDGTTIAPLVYSPVPTSISRRQCALELLARDLITADEALQMTATGAAPHLVETLIAKLPAAQQITARINFAAVNYDRGDPLLMQLMDSMGETTADIDNFFRAAAAQ